MEKLAYNREYGKKYRQRDPAHHAARMREWHRRNPFKWREYHYKNMYGMTVKQVKDLFDFQQGRCAICQQELIQEGPFRFNIDHDHGTKQVRGLLCRRCNRGLAHFGDSLEGLEKAKAYLNNPPGVLASNRSIPHV